jgi:hypothetical protein
MKTLITALVLSVATIAAADPSTKELPQITVGTNTYKAVTLRKRNAIEAILRFDGGITMVQIADLPEPIKSEWLDKAEAEKLSRERTEEIKRAQTALAKQEEEARRNRIPLDIFYQQKIEESWDLYQKRHAQTIKLSQMDYLNKGRLRLGNEPKFQPYEESIAIERQLFANYNAWKAKALAFSVASGKDIPGADAFKHPKAKSRK